MSRQVRVLAAAAFVGAATLIAQTADAQIGTGWRAYSPSFNEQERGCGDISGLTFRLSCSSGSGDQRAERRYASYSSGQRQFEGHVRVVSLGGTRISLKQTFMDRRGAWFMLGVERGGRLYMVRGGQTVGRAPVGTTVRVNTVHRVGGAHELYINGTRAHTMSGGQTPFYDKFGAYRTNSGQGPATVVWSSIRHWQK